MSTPVRPSGGPHQTLPEPAPENTLAGDFLLVAGDGRLSSHALGQALVIGRGDDCDVVIEHPTLSRRHAVVQAGPPITVQDLDSMNGTRIGAETRRGGEPIVIAVGDTFQIGPFTMVVVARSRPDDGSASWRDLLRVTDPTFDGVPSMIHELAASDANVVILGETGVGKEVLAETIHRRSGRRGELVRINCAALNEPLLESELFGHEKGAFTGATSVKIGLLEAADLGTVFLDEIGELPAGLQAKLLRAVERREVLRIGSTRAIAVDVRFVAATNRDLPAEVDAGRFRRDLFFRLDGVTLAIPPLRDRKGQIGQLALHFLDEACRRAGRPPVKLRAETLDALRRHGWPGNVRELKAVLERALLLSRGEDPKVSHLAFATRADPAREVPPAPPAEPDAPDDLSAGERDDRARVIRALDACAGNQTRAARQLGISRTTLVNKVRLYRIPRPRS